MKPLLKDFNAISKNYFGKIKSLFGLKTEYAKIFKEADPVYYQRVFDSKPLVLKDFLKFLDRIKEIKSVFEIGCSTGIFPIKYYDNFKNYDYTGLDISQKCIDYCNENSNFTFICADFIQYDLQKTFDLVFSFDVIDHVYDVKQFLTKIVNSTKKHAYIAAYVGYFPDLEQHTRRWDDKDGIYFNSLSVKNLKKDLMECGLSEKEFTIRPQLQGMANSKHTETIIEINRM